MVSVSVSVSAARQAVESLRALLPDAVAGELVPLLIDAVYANPVLQYRLSVDAREALLLRLRRWAERRGHARSLARMSIELSAVHREKASGGDFLFSLFSVDRFLALSGPWPPSARAIVCLFFVPFLL